MKIAILHYHWKRGGVTRVVESTLAPLHSQGHEVLLLSSSEGFNGSGELAGHITIEALAYREKGTPEQGADLAHHLIQKASEHWGSPPDVWHIHNHNLGKNPALSHAIRFLVNSGQRLLLHIHDFAEDMRAGNYRILRNNGALKELYPIHPNVHYAVLNGRDFRILCKAGVPPYQCHLLPNPVAPPPRAEAPIKDLPKNLVLYPTRAIRRKNIGELLLLAGLSDDVCWGTTLKPANPLEQPRYERWKHFASKHHLPIRWEMGEDPSVSFSGLFHGAAKMVTTSVAEGFGLAFLEPLSCGKTLIGRDLPEITNDFKNLGIPFPQLYPRIPIPVELLPQNTWEILTQAALETAISFSINPPSTREIQEALCVDDTIDFGCLNEGLQELCIESISINNTLRDRLRQHLLPLEQPIPSDIPNLVNKEFSQQNYGKTLENLYQRLAQGSGHPSPMEFLPPHDILKGFLDWQRFSCLR